VCHLGIVFQPMKRNQPEVRSRQNCESSLAVYTPVAIKILTMLSRRNNGAILVRGREIHPKPCQGGGTEFTPSRYPGSANRPKLGWQCRQMCLSATPLKRQTFLSVADMSEMSSRHVGDILLCRPFFWLSASCRRDLLPTHFPTCT
jgi:hypothetical protein